MLTETISSIAVWCLENTGYVGAAVMMALESMIAPVPSEAVMPFVGFLVADGKWNLWAAIAATSAGSIIGSWLSYLMGYYGGKPLVLKVGRYLLLDMHDLEAAERFFQRRSGAMTVFIARFVPIIRHLISIPAGMGKMPMRPFLVATLVGATIWNSLLLWLGMVLRDHWQTVQKYSHAIDMGLLPLLVIGAVWWYVRRRKQKLSRLKGAAQ